MFRILDVLEKTLLVQNEFFSTTMNVHKIGTYLNNFKITKVP